MASIIEPYQKRRAFSLEFKLGVLDWMRNSNESVRGTARKFGIHRRMVQRWKERESELTRAFVANGAHRKKIRLHNQPLFQELEDKLLKWLRTDREPEETPSDSNIRSRALSISKDIGLDGFKASSTWITSFKDRHNKPNAITCEYSSTNDKQPPTVTSPSSRSQFLSQSRPNEHIKLIDGHASSLIEPSPSLSSTHSNDTNNHFIYLDYQAPEHNYCKGTYINTDSAHCMATPTAVYTIRLSERTFDSRSPLPDLCRYEEDHAFRNMSEEFMSSLSDPQGDTIEDIRPSVQDFTPPSPRGGSPLVSGYHNQFPSSYGGTPPPPSSCMDIDGVLTIATRTHQPEFTMGPELVYPFGGQS